MTEQQIRAFVRTLLTEEDLTPEDDKKKDQMVSNRKDEIIDTIRRLFSQIKNNSFRINHFRELYQKLSGNEESQAAFLNHLHTVIHDRFLFLLRLIPRDAEAAKLFEKETIPIINDELEKAFINLKERITS